MSFTSSNSGAGENVRNTMRDLGIAIANDIASDVPSDLELFTARPCASCGYVKSHRQGVPFQEFNESHYTCLCGIFSDSVICCIRGYENLLMAIPILAIYTNLPTSYYWHLENAVYSELNIRLARLNDDLVQQCSQVKIYAMNSVPYLSNRVSPVFVDDYTCA